MDHLDGLSPLDSHFIFHKLHFSCRCSLLRREWESSGPFQPLLTEEVAKLLEFLLPFSGQSGNQAGANHQSGNSPAQLCQQFPEERPISPTVHQAENFIIAMLDGNIQIFDNFVLRGNHVNQFVVNFIRINIVYPNPMKAIDLTQLS